MGGVYYNQFKNPKEETKMSKKIFSIILVVLMMMTSVMVYAEDGTVVDIAVNDGSFTTLVAALQKAELVEALSGEGPFTVFAPTDDAFADLLAQLDITAEDLLNHPQLSDVLLYHVVSGKVMSTDLSEGLEAPTLKGDNIMVSLEGGVFINDSEVVTADIEGSNGVIHVIDQVLVPGDFVLETEEEQEPVPLPDTGVATGVLAYSALAALGVSGMVLTKKKNK
jgi:LPXTG-motif cell wall-anchored protein